MSDLTRSIPIALDRMLKDVENQHGQEIFTNALPALLSSYGSVCSSNGVYA